MGSLVGVAAGRALTGAGYSILLIAHVASAAVGFGALCVTGVQAARARGGPSGPKAGSVRRYFGPGPNRIARALYGVPVFGFALLAASHRAFEASDTFVVVGLVLWLAAALVAEVVVWPGERRIQVGVAQVWQASGHDPLRVGEPVEDPAEELRRECGRVIYACALLAAVFVAAVVIMFAQP